MVQTRKKEVAEKRSTTQTKQTASTPRTTKAAPLKANAERSVKTKTATPAKRK